MGLCSAADQCGLKWPSEKELQPPSGSPALEFSGGLTLEIHGRAIQMLSPLSLKSGEAALLTGPTGSGKTSFLTVLAGLTDFSLLAGQLNFEPGPRPVAVVTQNPDLQTLGASVWEEALSGALNYGLDRAEAEAGAARWLNRLGLTGKESLAPEQLSTGQRQRLALAAALNCRPGFLMLDEPLSQLDAVGRAELLELLTELKAEGLTILLIEHRLVEHPGLVDHRVELKALAELDPPPSESDDETARPGQGAAYVLEGRGLSLKWPTGSGRTVVIDDFRIAAGRRIALTGVNGSGKSTFFSALAGLGPNREGAWRWLAQDGLSNRDLVGRVGFLSQNPERQFFNESVRQEVAFTIRRLGRPAPDIEAVADKWLKRLGLASLADRRPQDLSFGQKHLLGLALTLAPEPELLILDEPFTGLDARWRNYLKIRLSRGWGTYKPALMIFCHDEPDPDFQLDEIWRFEAADDGSRLVTGQSWPPEVPEPQAEKKRAQRKKYGYPGQFLPGRSWLHSCHPALKFGGISLLASVAILSRSPWISLGAGLVTVALALSAGLARPMFRDLRLFLWPLPFMVLLYCLRFGFNLASVSLALEVAGRLVTAGWPFFLLQRSTDPELMQKGLRRFLSGRQAFLLSAGVKIAPLIFREIPALVGLQRLRGARLYCRKFFKKPNRADWLQAFFLPLTIRILDLADEMTVIARLRGLEGNPARAIQAPEAGPPDHPAL